MIAAAGTARRNAVSHWCTDIVPSAAEGSAQESRSPAPLAEKDWL